MTEAIMQSRSMDWFLYNLQGKSMNWFLCDNGLRHESVKENIYPRILKIT